MVELGLIQQHDPDSDDPGRGAETIHCGTRYASENRNDHGQTVVTSFAFDLNHKSENLTVETFMCPAL